jgi:hypothetical protein
VVVLFSSLILINIKLIENLIALWFKEDVKSIIEFEICDYFFYKSFS